MDLKAKLSGAQWRLHVERTLNLDGEELPVVIRRPPEHVLLNVLEEAKKAGEVDAEHKPTSDANAIRLLARLTALCLFAPGGLRPLFQPSEIETVVQAPWLLELQQDVQSALGHAQVLTEAAKTFSDATPTSATR